MMRSTWRRRVDLLFPSYLLLALLSLWMGGAHWQGEWQWTLDNINGVTALLGPYAAAAAAWHVVRAEANAVLTVSTPRGWAVPLRIGASVASSALLAWLIAAASGIIATASVVHGGPLPLWVLVAGPLSLAACIAAGIAIAHEWPSRIGAILVAPTLFVVGGLGANGALPDLIRQGPGTSSLAGLRWNPLNFALAMTALTLLTTALVLASARRRDVVSLRSLALPALTTSALVACLLIAHVASPSGFTTSREQPTLCSPSVPAVCVAPSNAHALTSLSQKFEDYVPAARRIGFDMPASFREVLPNHRGGAIWGDVNLGSLANDTASTQEVVTALVTPGDCRAYYDPAGAPAPVIYQAQSVLAALLTRVHSGNLSDLTDPGFMSWARATYRDLRTCRLDAIRAAPIIP